MINNNNNISKKAAGYCVSSFCVTLSKGEELNSGLPRLGTNTLILHVVLEFGLEHGIAIRTYSTDYLAMLSQLPGDIGLSEMENCFDFN